MLYPFLELVARFPRYGPNPGLNVDPDLLLDALSLLLLSDEYALGFVPLARASTADAILSQRESFPFPFDDLACPSCINALLLALPKEPPFKPFNGGDGRPSLGDFGI